MQNVQPSPEICGNAIDENCDGVVDASGTVFFYEPFANNNAGWAPAGLFAIGPTVYSNPTSCGLGDPAEDHTPTADNGVAGTVLGGNVPQALGVGYLTSPIIDTSAASSLYLEYWRWLNSDYPPFMTDTVEVYDGSSWVVVWANQTPILTQDAQWTKMSHDVTAYKNANFRVRFTIFVNWSNMVYLCSGWNIDDVQLVDAPCP